MNTRPSPRRRLARGLTLLEMSIVLGVLLAVMAVIYVGARAWKRGADRTSCVMTIRQTQVAVRSYQNIRGYAPGGTTDPLSGGGSIARQLYDSSFISEPLYQKVSGGAECPGGGTYTNHGSMFPPAGECYVECSLAGSEDHLPLDPVGW